MGREHQIKVFEECKELMLDLVRLPVPVIAVVNGLAAAAGCQLVAMCDIAVATENSSFSTPGMSSLPQATLLCYILVLPF